MDKHDMMLSIAIQYLKNINFKPQAKDFHLQIICIIRWPGLQSLSMASYA